MVNKKNKEQLKPGTGIIERNILRNEILFKNLYVNFYYNFSISPSVSCDN